MIDGSVNLVGKVLDDLVVAPMPKRLKNLFRFKRSINETDFDEEFSQTHHHIVFKKLDPKNDEVHRGISKISFT